MQSGVVGKGVTNRENSRAKSQKNPFGKQCWAWLESWVPVEVVGRGSLER